MRRSRSFIAVLAVTIFSSSIFCCCLGAISHATDHVQEPSVPECHRSAADEPASATEECDCPQLISLTLQKSFVDIQLVQLKNFKADNISPGAFLHQISDSTGTTVSWQAPPDAAVHATPLYLRYSNLRL
jgi:hypothetical protein